MTVLAPPPPAPPQPPPPPPRGPSAVPVSPLVRRRRARRRALALGLIFLVLVAGVVVLILELFGGTFSSYSVVDAQLPASSTAVALNAPVEYRNVTVGNVASQGVSVPGGLVSITLHLIPSMLSAIPADVTATETPESFFGNAYIVLQPPAHPSSATLQAGATIPPLRTGATASLQATLGDLDQLLTSLHPAALDEALTAVAGALQGQGTSLGKNLVAGNNYLSKMLPLWPTVVADLKMIVPVSQAIEGATPNILAILANQTTTGKTIDSDAANTRELIAGGASLTTETDALLAAIQQPFAVLAADAGPFLQDISQNPQEISELLQGLDAWARSWTAAESSGPYLKLTSTVTVVNPADLGLAVIGGPEISHYLAAGLGASYVNPQTYSSAGSVPSSSASTAALLRTLSAAPGPVLPAAQGAAASQIYAALNGGHRPPSPAVTALLLSPVLAHLVSHS
jgi:virulence factor Mce-like protein